jgi:hypothetical protein
LRHGKCGDEEQNNKRECFSENGKFSAHNKGFV